MDHKDYSLNGLLNCFKNIPLTKEKLLCTGMRLLTVSDKAQSIGDNRTAGEIDATLFDTAVELGVKYVSALFEFKNTPEEFYNWRNCFLNSYYKKVLDGTLCDTDLVSLYRIVNAWINEDIETSVKRAYNKVNHLYNYNYKIIECIRDDKIREKLMSYGKCSQIAEGDTDNHINYSSSDYNGFFYEIKEKGYCKEIEEKIITMFSDVYSGQVKMLITIGNMIDKNNNREFISNCVVQYIIKKRKYGYLGIGANQLIDSFYNDFSDNDWMKLFNNIISSPYSSRSIEDFYSLNEDIETLCLYYYKAHMPDKMLELCENMLDVHWSWLTSCGLTNLFQYELSIDNRINSLEEFATYQLRDSDI